MEELPEEDRGSDLIMDALGITYADFWLFVVTLAIALVAMVVVQYFKKNVIKSIEDSKEKLISDNNELLEAIERNLNPRVVHCSNEIDVVEEASSMIEAAIDAVDRSGKQVVSEAKPSAETLEQKAVVDVQPELSVTSLENERAQDPFITFYGAADLGSPTTISKESKDGKVFSNFTNLLERAVERGVRIRRYVNLFSKDELEGRSTTAKELYLIWLVSRYEYLHANNKFVLVNNLRVPQWGASFSSLLTNDALLEIKANGLSGIAIYNREISINIRRSLRRARDQADDARIKNISRDNQDAMSWYFEYIISAAQWCDIDLKETYMDDKNLKFKYFTKGGVFEEALLEKEEVGKAESSG